MSRLFKGITLVLTAIGIVVILWQQAELLQVVIASIQLSLSKNPPSVDLLLKLNLIIVIKNTTLLLIATVVEIALIWLLLLLNVISQRRGLIATLVLFILDGITIFLVYRFLPLP